MDNNEENNQQEVREETQKERNIRNNENNIRNAAEVAKASGNGIAMAIGTGVQIADKVSGGKSTQKLAKQLNTANKILPGGRKVQRLLNKSSESGASDVAGEVASKKNMVNGNSGNGINSSNNNSSANSNNSSSDNNSINTSNDALNSDSSKNSGKGNFKKKNISKVKLKIIIALIGFFFTSAIFICVFIAPLMALDIIDINSLSSGSNNNNNGSISQNDYTTVSKNINYWLPIGSKETEQKNGVTYASGSPIAIKISSPFGNRIDPYTGETKYHSGIDLVPDGGSYGFGDINVVAVKSGTITTALNDPNCESNGNDEVCNGSGYGNYVMIQHDDGTVTVYGHLHKNTITVKEGEIVDQGQVIGKMGSSGRSTGMHLHFEVRENGSAVNPTNFVDINNSRPNSELENLENESNNEEVKNENT